MSHPIVLPGAPALPKLTGLQQRFVEEFLVDLNATQAAIRAGYTKKNADVVGPRLLTHPAVAETLRLVRQRWIARLAVDNEAVLQELAAVAFSDIGDVLDFSGETIRMREPHEVPERARRAIASVKVQRVVQGRGKSKRTVELMEFKFWPKTEALDKLGRHLGIFEEDNRQRGEGTRIGLEALRELVAAARAKRIP